MRRSSKSSKPAWRAKANEHRMGPRPAAAAQGLREPATDARYGFFGADWLTALLLFEALDNDYVHGRPFIRRRSRRATGAEGTSAVGIGAAAISAAETSGGARGF